MITLFRRIRQKLIDSGNVTKYLLYAIGEILLVVIGILIALQVNNWNEVRKARFDERALLTNVLDAVLQDSVRLENSLSTLDRINDIHRTLYRIQKKELSADSLADTYLLRRSILNRPVSNNNYPDLANQVIDPGVRNAALNYYQSLRSWQFIMDNYNDFIENAMRPALAEERLLNFGFSFENVNSNDLINNSRLIQMLDDPDFQQLLIEASIKAENLKGVEGYLVNQRENLKAEIKRMLE